MPSGLDQSWGYADPKSAYRAGVRVVSMYLSYDSSKNINPSKVRAYHKAGVASLLNWESQSGAPLKGAGQGRADATEAVRQAKALIKAVGYAPNNKLTIYFSCDTDTTSGEYDAIDAYYRAAKQICAANGFGVGAYGEADLVIHLAKSKITDSEWQTYAWSGGRLSPVTDFYQYQNGQTLGGASVDFDQVIHPAQLGAWWPPGNQYDSQGEQIMAKLDADDKKWLLDNLGPVPVAHAILNKKYRLKKESLRQETAATDPNYTLAQYILGAWNFTRGDYYKPDHGQVDVNELAKAVAAALPKNAGTLTEADIEAAVKKAVNGSHIQTP